jgi:hypothetical protein
MEELNTTQSVTTIEENDFDTLVVTDMGEAVSLAQVAEDSTLHNVVIGMAQAKALLAKLQEIVG